MAKLQGIILLNSGVAELQIVDGSGHKIETVKREYSENDLELRHFNRGHAACLISITAFSAIVARL